MRFLLRRSFPLVYLILFAFVLVACGGATPASPTATVTLPSATPLPTHTPVPTSTPTPAMPQVILLAPAGADEATSAALQELLAELSTAASLRFEVRASLSPEELEGVRIVVALPPDAGLSELAVAAPGVQFMALDIPEAVPASNLSMIVSQASRPDQMGFLAGYTAAMITEDWRTGVIYLDGDPGGKGASLGFENGTTYFCGLCLPVYPPFPTTGYPIQVGLPASAGPDDWQVALNAMQTWQVETVFVYPAVAEEGLLAMLAEEGMNLIVAGPPASAWRGHWVASIGAADPLEAVEDTWAHLLEGEGGAQVTLGLGFTSVNHDLFSPGRQRMAEDLLAELLAGFIDTGVDPVTGEGR